MILLRNCSILLGCSLLALLNGCVTGPVNSDTPSKDPALSLESIDIKDDREIYQGSVSFEFSANKGYYDTLDLEFSHFSTAGNSTLEIKSLSYISHEGADIGGPVTLLQDYEVDKFDLIVRANKDFTSDFGITVLFGFSEVSQSFFLDSGVDVLKHDKTYFVPQVGSGIKFVISNKFSAHLEYRIGFGSNSDYDFEEEMIFFRFAPVKSLKFDFGYKSLYTSFYQTGSDVEYQLSGPWLGLRYEIR